MRLMLIASTFCGDDMRVAELKKPTIAQQAVLIACNLKPDGWLVADAGKGYLEVVSVRRARRRCINYYKKHGKVKIK